MKNKEIINDKSSITKIGELDAIGTSAISNIAHKPNSRPNNTSTGNSLADKFRAVIKPRRELEEVKAYAQAEDMSKKEAVKSTIDASSVALNQIMYSDANMSTLGADQNDTFINKKRFANIISNTSLPYKVSMQPTLISFDDTGAMLINGVAPLVAPTGIWDTCPKVGGLNIVAPLLSPVAVIGYKCKIIWRDTLIGQPYLKVQLGTWDNVAGTGTIFYSNSMLQKDKTKEGNVVILRAEPISDLVISGDVVSAPLSSLNNNAVSTTAAPRAFEILPMVYSAADTIDNIQLGLEGVNCFVYLYPIVVTKEIYNSITANFSASKGDSLGQTFFSMF